MVHNEQHIADGLVEGVEYKLEKVNEKLQNFVVNKEGKKTINWSVTFNNNYRVDSYSDSWEFYQLGLDRDLVIKLTKEKLEELKNERS